MEEEGPYKGVFTTTLCPTGLTKLAYLYVFLILSHLVPFFEDYIKFLGE